MSRKAVLPAILAILSPWSSLLLAQEPSPVIYLSAEEAARTKQVLSDLKGANYRIIQAAGASEKFHQSFQSLHPELPNLRFTSDCRHAFTLRESTLSSTMEAEAMELSAEDRKRLESLLREKEDSERTARQAEIVWRDHELQFLADHVTSTGRGAVRKLPSGRIYTIREPWTAGVAFSSSFQLAVPERR